MNNRESEFKPLVFREQIRARERSGFTLTELIVTLATLGILATLILPALANPQPKAFQCLNNMRELALAWTLYAGDNQEVLPINSDQGADYQGSHCWVTGNMDWTTNPRNFDTKYLINDGYSQLGGYCNRNPKIFACPSANYVSPAQRALGYDHRVRSVAMNAAVGAGNKTVGLGFSFPFVAKKVTDFHSPGPSDVWVFLDEHPDSIDDEVMYVNPAFTNGTGTFMELPGNDHDGACGISFADSHVELHKWQTATVARRPVIYSTAQRIIATANADLAWLALHMPSAQ